MLELLRGLGPGPVPSVIGATCLLKLGPVGGIVFESDDKALTGRGDEQDELDHSHQEQVGTTESNEASPPHPVTDYSKEQQ